MKPFAWIGCALLGALSACCGGAAGDSVITKQEPTPEIRQKYAREYKLVQDLGMTQEVLTNKDGEVKYCQGVYNADQPGKFAILVFLHGLGETGSENLVQNRGGVQGIVKRLREDNRKVILLTPQCPSGTTWAPLHRGGAMGDLAEQQNAVLAMIPALVQKKVKEFHADPDRVYVTGLSMGGYGTWDIISRCGTDVFAAAIPCCGGGDPNQAGRKLKDLPIWIFHGGADPVVPVQLSRRIFQDLRDAGNTEVFYKEYPGVDHNCWDRTYADKAVWDWLFSQKRGQKSGIHPAQAPVSSVTKSQYAAGFGFNGGPRPAGLKAGEGMLPPFPTDAQKEQQRKQQSSGNAAQ